MGYMKFNVLQKLQKIIQLKRVSNIYANVALISCVSPRLKRAKEYKCSPETIAINTCCAGIGFVYDPEKRELIRKELGSLNRIFCSFSTGGDNTWQNTDKNNGCSNKRRQGH